IEQERHLGRIVIADERKEVGDVRRMVQRGERRFPVARSVEGHGGCEERREERRDKWGEFLHVGYLKVEMRRSPRGRTRRRYRSDVTAARKISPIGNYRGVGVKSSIVESTGRIASISGANRDNWPVSPNSAA